MRVSERNVQFWCMELCRLSLCEANALLVSMIEIPAMVFAWDGPSARRGDGCLKLFPVTRLMVVPIKHRYAPSKNIFLSERRHLISVVSEDPRRRILEA